MLRMFLLLVLLALTASGCAGSLHGLRVYKRIDPLPASDTDVQVQYLRTGGFLFRRGTNTILTAPFYSTPGFWDMALTKIASDPCRIKLEPVPDASAILVGHSHYDHAMDLPYIANNLATNAIIYGSTTLKNILVAAVPTNRVKSVQVSAGDFFAGGKPGTWIDVPGTGNRVRFMPLRSEHAPHIFCINFMDGPVIEPQTNLPTRSWGWKEGQTLAYLIDFMAADGSVDYRILYQDSASSSPEFGALPVLPDGDTKEVDLLIVCLASFHNVDDYPEGIIAATSPRDIVVGHWEDFFRHPDKETKVVRGTNGKKFMKKVYNVHCSDHTFLPEPGAWMLFQPKKP